jgi:hypothetical protein
MVFRRDIEQNVCYLMHIYTEVFEGLRVFFVFLTGLLNVYSHHEVKK